MRDLFQLVQQFIGSGFTLYLWNGFVAFAVVMIIGFFLKYFLQTVGRNLVSKTETELDDKLFDILLPRVKWLAIVIGLYLAVEQISKGIGPTDRIGEELIRYSEGIMYIAFLSLFTLLVIRIIDTLLKHTMEVHAKKTSSTVNEAVFPILNRLVMILILCIAVVFSLGHFGVDVSSLLVFLGGGSVAIALAAQETLANMIAGFVIMFDRPFRLGDRIKLPSGEIGDVHEIGLRSTKILDFDNNIIVSPNAELTKTKIINYSYPRNEIRVVVEVKVAYGTSIERAHAPCGTSEFRSAEAAGAEYIFQRNGRNILHASINRTHRRLEEKGPRRECFARTNIYCIYEGRGFFRHCTAYCSTFSTRNSCPSQKQLNPNGCIMAVSSI